MPGAPSKPVAFKAEWFTVYEEPAKRMFRYGFLGKGPCTNLIRISYRLTKRGRWSLYKEFEVKKATEAALLIERWNGFIDELDHRRAAL